MEVHTELTLEQKNLLPLLAVAPFIQVCGYLFPFEKSLSWLCSECAMAVVAVGDGLKNQILMSQACTLAIR